MERFGQNKAGGNDDKGEKRAKISTESCIKDCQRQRHRRKQRETRKKDRKGTGTDMKGKIRTKQSRW